MAYDAVTLNDIESRMSNLAAGTGLFYEKTKWIDDITPLSAENLNKIEDCLEVATDVLASQGAMTMRERTSNFTNFYATYVGYGGSEIKYFPSSTSKATIMTSCFSGCSNLLKFPNGLDFSSCTNANNFATECQKAAQLSSFYFPKLTHCGSMFYNCKAFNKPIEVYIPKAKYIPSMFAGCKMPSIKMIFDTTSAKDTMGGIFNGCSELLTCEFVNMYGFVTAARAFYNCKKLQTVKGFNISRFSYAEFVKDTFYGCVELVNIEFLGTISVSGLNFSDCEKLSVASMLNILNALSATSTKRTITFGETNLAKLTEEQIAIGVNKGWTIA